MRGCILTLLLAASAALGGCMPTGIDGVRKGMFPRDVEDCMAGKPLRIVRGDGTDVDKKTFVYPQGRIHFLKERVIYVEKNSEQPTLTGKTKQLEELDR